MPDSLNENAPLTLRDLKNLERAVDASLNNLIELQKVDRLNRDRRLDDIEKKLDQNTVPRRDFDEHKVAVKERIDDLADKIDAVIRDTDTKYATKGEHKSTRDILKGAWVVISAVLAGIILWWFSRVSGR